MKGRVRRILQGATPDPLFVDFFSRWLDGQINELLFEFVSTPPPHWQNKYIDQAFARGIATSQRDIKRLDVDFTTSRVASSAAIGLLYGRAFEDLKGITGTMQAQMTRELVKGIQLETSTAGLISSINDRVDKIGITRSTLLANTQTVSSFNTAVIDNVRNFERDTGEEGKLLWITRQDGRVRTTHALRNRKLFTPKVAMNLINEPNCRCRLTAVVGDALDKAEGKTASKQRTKTRRAGLAESDQATVERRFRATLDRARRAEGMPPNT